VAVVGSPGGRTIINSVLQVILNVIDFEMSMPDAVSAKRLHHAWLPNTVRVEEGGISEAVKQELESMGHRMIVRGRQGVTHCIMIDPVTSERIGAADPRDVDGRAVGY
jgi:gamma-glutamyltranspeptidase/glutathione hydrolase